MLDVWSHSATGEVRVLKRSDSKINYPSQHQYHIAWLIALLALDFPIEDGLALARAQLNVSRETWACNLNLFPRPVFDTTRFSSKADNSTPSSLLISPSAFPDVEAVNLAVYPVVDSVAWIERLLPMGIKTIQLRIKNTEQAGLEAQIIRAIELGKKYKAQVFINDYWQLVLKHGGFGVHLGQEDLESADLVSLMEAGVCLRLSTHGYYELLRIIQINPSYIALGHVFPTPTKQMASAPQGLIRLRLYQRLIETIPNRKIGCPTVAIGGIALSNAHQVWQTFAIAADPKCSVCGSSQPSSIRQAGALL